MNHVCVWSEGIQKLVYITMISCVTWGAWGPSKYELTSGVGIGKDPLQTAKAL